MKKMAILLGLVMVVGIASLSFAATDTIDLLVTPITNVSVNIISTQYDYGTVALHNGTTVNTAAIVVENDGDAPASWEQSAGSATGGGSTWTLVSGSAASTDNFRLWGKIQTAQPGSFIAGDAVTGSVSSIDGGSGVASGLQKNLWIKLEMPWAVTGADGDAQHTCTYTVTATGD